ncbi:MAG: FKBP-type peptidyl-prolyl cis-trans isomerase [Myxococcota bacterium]|nr:FKBP-type peptidyl-prolyl cis-trans isomerase [Myxococcota bacterium]
MKRIARTGTAAAAVGIAALLGCSQTNATVTTALTSEDAQESYSLGVAVAQQASAGLQGIDQAAFMAGFADAMKSDDLALSVEQMAAALERYDEQRMAEAQQQFEQMAQSNRAQGEAFRAEFAKDPAVVTTETGLQYKVLSEGQGEVPGGESVVTFHYRGTALDGREIDSTWSRNEPVTIPVDAGLPGWTEVFSQMPVGSKWQVVLPPELAFGESGAAGVVQPGETVVFEIELVSVG